jgi:CRISPR-associated protein Cmr5
MKNLDQQRARQALFDINHVTEGCRKEYASLARSLPMMLQTNGLAQTMAFLNSKAPDSDAHQQVLRNLSQWLNETIRRQEEDGDFLKWIVEQQTILYRHAADEAIEFSIWLRRFAEAQGWE